MAEGPSLRRRAATSVVWSGIRFGGDQFFNFIIFATLTRLLAPEQFGVFVLALGVTEVGKVLAQGGLVNVLFRHKEITPVIGDTIFWANVAMGVLIAFICILFREPLAAALGSPSAADVIGVISLAVPISALGASHMARNLREFGHRALAIRSLFAGVVGGGLAVWAAFAGWGVWSLVVQRLTTELIGTLIAWWSFRWLPGLRFSWLTLREQLGLGASVAGSQLLLVGIGRVQEVIISRLIGLPQVGVYRTGSKTIEIIAQGVITPFTSVTGPTLLKLTHDMDQFRRGYLKLVGASALVSFPAIVGAGAIADLLVPLLYGPRWIESIVITQILSFMALPYALNYFADPALTVLGKSKLIAQLAAVQLVSTLLLCGLAAPYGLAAFAGAYVCRAYLTMALQLHYFQREAGIRIGRMLKTVAPPFFAAAGMAVALAAVRSFLPAAGPDVRERILLVACLVGVGIATYALLVWLFMGRAQRAELLGHANSLAAQLRSR